jgi:hypothetical protein
MTSLPPVVRRPGDWLGLTAVLHALEKKQIDFSWQELNLGHAVARPIEVCRLSFFNYFKASYIFLALVAIIECRQII